MNATGFTWPQIARLGLVQAAIGAVVMLSTSLLNRVMVVEYHLWAAIPAGLVAWHYAVQLTRPLWGHGSDRGARRTPWIIGGVGVTGLGTLLAVDALALTGLATPGGIALAIIAYLLVGAGVGAAGTSLLALLATGVAPERRAAAAASTWILMILGIVVAAGTTGKLIEPFSVARLATVVGGVVLVAFVLTIVAVGGIERHATLRASGARHTTFAESLAEIRADRTAALFTLFVFMAMLAYSMQDLILEPFAGLAFGMTPGESTALGGLQHGGVLAGMIVAGVVGGRLTGRSPGALIRWIAAGCVASALALIGLAASAMAGPTWPLRANVVLLGFANGIFTVSAIGAMMALAGAGGAKAQAGTRMGVWGAAQAIAFGLGGLVGAVGVDGLREVTGQIAPAFAAVFVAEAALFVVAAALILKLAPAGASPATLPVNGALQS